jgi:hypothetical protein
MCLYLRESPLHNEPYDESNVRYKILKKRNRWIFRTPFRDKWVVRGWKYRAQWDKSSKETRETWYGFHVFASREEAIGFFVKVFETRENYAVVKVKVSGFLRSGTFGDYRMETWEKMRIIGIVEPIKEIE